MILIRFKSCTQKFTEKKKFVEKDCSKIILVPLYVKMPFKAAKLYLMIFF